MKKPECKVHKEVYYTLTLTSDINGGVKNMYTGRVAGDVVRGVKPPSDGSLAWHTGNHNETSTVPIGGHTLKKHTVTEVTTVFEETEVIL